MAEVCKKCGIVDTEKRLCPDTSPHYAGLYCKDCGAWIKWLPKPKVRHGYAVIHITSGTMESCEVFLDPEAASDRQAEMFEEIRKKLGVEGFPEYDLDMYNESGDRLLTIEDCKIIPDESETGGVMI